jgi:hypothetical protein
MCESMVKTISSLTSISIPFYGTIKILLLLWLCVGTENIETFYHDVVHSKFTENREIIDSVYDHCSNITNFTSFSNTVKSN